nr:hypothetical protein [Tanacetum cinerariifolium]
MNRNYIEPNSSGFDQPPQYSINHQPLIIQEYLNLKLISDELMIEQRNELFIAMKCMFEEYRQQETIPLNKTISQIPSSIVITTSPLILPTNDLEDSLIMGNEELNTIAEKKSDEFIKSSVKDLVPIPSESEDTSGSDSECILPSCDYFSPIDIPEEKAVTFSNPLFNSNDDVTSSDDESLSDEDVSEDNVKIYLNHLFEFDDEYISSDVNPLLDEVLENIKRKDSYDSNLDEPHLLVTPLSDANKDECFDLGGDGFTDDSPLKENDDLFDSKSKDNDWKKILYNAPIDDLMTEDKVFDPGIHDQIFSPTYDCPDFEDSRAHGFVHRPLELLSLACLYI